MVEGQSHWTFHFYQSSEPSHLFILINTSVYLASFGNNVELIINIKYHIGSAAVRDGLYLLINHRQVLLYDTLAVLSVLPGNPSVYASSTCSFSWRSTRRLSTLKYTTGWHLPSLCSYPRVFMVPYLHICTGLGMWTSTGNLISKGTAFDYEDGLKKEREREKISTSLGNSQGKVKCSDRVRLPEICEHI